MDSDKKYLNKNKTDSWMMPDHQEQDDKQEKIMKATQNQVTVIRETEFLHL